MEDLTYFDKFGFLSLDPCSLFFLQGRGMFLFQVFFFLSFAIGTDYSLIFTTSCFEGIFQFYQWQFLILQKIHSLDLLLKSRSKCSESCYLRSDMQHTSFCCPFPTKLLDLSNKNQHAQVNLNFIQTNNFLIQVPCSI